jgi:toxin ParE1/3/4
MRYTFHPFAVEEFYIAMEYYDKVDWGLGLQFSNEIYESIQRILKFPTAWPILLGNNRRCIIKRFPYALIYEIIDENILINVVMHLNRKPDYWKDRIN